MYLKKCNMDSVLVDHVNMHFLTPTILSSLNKKRGSTALLLLIDFSKGFDMIDHEILLEILSLRNYGTRSIVHQCFKSYLVHQKQFASVGRDDSYVEDLLHGVSQGSIMGPILFIKYIYDLLEISKLAKFKLYADDANKFVIARLLRKYSKHN